MIDDLPPGLTARHPVEGDHPRVLAVLDRWWGGLKGAAGARERALLLPRLYFQHFAASSFVVEHPDGGLAAFLVGFLSDSEPDAAYVHFVGVDPALQGSGVGAALYRAFFALARRHGRRTVRCVTSPENTGSRAFHARLGFTASPVRPDYDGPGLDRVVFTLELDPDPASAPVSAPVPEPAPAPAQARGLRLLDGVYALEHRPDAAGPAGDWLAAVRAPEGLTVIRPAGPDEERWLALYDADPDHGLDVPGLLAAVLVPLAAAGVPVFTASTHHADVVLVPERRRADALVSLHRAGFTVR
ncbi:GNAT family N-acetyltransferase [Kitasatospora terrestris]|uniref:GNAT family N-acetyltransferase n=1 Tax=Kitasatospora terrestris TaxID=258051 RepID=UPI0031E63BAC